MASAFPTLEINYKMYHLKTSSRYQWSPFIFSTILFSIFFRSRTHGQIGTQICDPFAINCPEGHDSVSKTWEIYLTRGHLFDSEGHFLEIKGHLFDREGHLFDRKGHLF